MPYTPQNQNDEAWDAYDLTRTHQDFIGTYEGSAEAVAEQLERDGYIGDPDDRRRKGSWWIIDEAVLLKPATEG